MGFFFFHFSFSFFFRQLLKNYFYTNFNTFIFLQESRPRKDSVFQNASLLESESSLAWTVLWVFRCRYRPAQLRIEHMTQQLEEAEVQYFTSLHFLQNLQLWTAADSKRCNTSHKDLIYRFQKQPEQPLTSFRRCLITKHMTSVQFNSGLSV